jgi:hypothetical protein
MSVHALAQLVSSTAQFQHLTRSCPIWAFDDISGHVPRAIMRQDKGAMAQCDTH